MKKGSQNDSEEELPLVGDAPPSYDFATTLDDDSNVTAAGPGPSTSTSASGSRSTSQAASVAKANLHLFSGPPNAEPVYANIPTSLGVLGDIAVSTKGWKSDTWDNKLNDRESKHIRTDRGQERGH